MSTGGLKLGQVTISHPGARERQTGATSKMSLGLWTESGRDRSIPLSEDDLVRLIASASKVLAILRGVHR